jgi:hypothetical protein
MFFLQTLAAKVDARRMNEKFMFASIALKQVAALSFI